MTKFAMKLIRSICMIGVGAVVGISASHAYLQHTVRSRCWRCVLNRLKWDLYGRHAAIRTYDGSGIVKGTIISIDADGLTVDVTPTLHRFFCFDSIYDVDIEGGMSIDELLQKRSQI